MPKGILRTLETGAVAAALGYLALFLFFAVQRVGYPFELEWMEGGSLEHLMRVLRHEPLFVTPSLEFVPFPYPPFYYYLAAALSPVFGADFFTLRLISLASTVGTALVIFRWVRRESTNSVWACASAGVFLATWRASGLFFDIARVDSLFCFLLIVSLYLVRFAETRRGLALGAFVAFLAVMTKQTGAVVVAGVALWCILIDWNANGRGLARLKLWHRTWAYALPLAALVGGGTLLLNGIVDEHFLLHIVNAQQSHEILSWKIGLFFGNDLATTLPLACLVVLGWLLVPGARSGDGTGAREVAEAGKSFYAIVLFGMLLAGMIPRIKVSGAANSLIPVYAWLGVLFGVGLGRLREALGRRGSEQGVPWFDGAAACGLLAQLVLLFHMPVGYLPSAADREAGMQFLGELEAIEGEVLMPGQGYLAGRVGKQVFAHQMPVSDYAKSGLPEAPAMREEYRQAIRDRRFSLIIDGNTSFVRKYVGPQLLDEHYEMTGWVFPDASVFLPISGAQIRPGKIWTRRAEP